MTVHCECCGGTAPRLTPSFPDESDLASIGASVLNRVVTTITLGHTTPADSLSYVQLERDPNRSAGPHIAADLIAWSGRRGDWQPAASRLTHYVKASGWQRSTLAGVVEAMTSP